MSLDEHRAANLANWNERVAGHTANDGYGIAALVADPDHISDVVAFDRDAFGAVDGRTLLHSQCHIGTDTVSWAKLGAVVTGIDFSPRRWQQPDHSPNELGSRQHSSRPSCTTPHSTFPNSSTASTPASARSTGCPTSPSGAR